jgi:hypothetical protein
MQYCISYLVCFITIVLCGVIFFAAGGYGSQSFSAVLEVAWLPVVFAPLGAPVAVWLVRRLGISQGLFQRR